MASTTPEAVAAREWAPDATGSIAGRVTADAGGEPIPGMCVSASGPSFGSIFTNPDGTYELSGLAPGIYTVSSSDCVLPVDYAPEYYDDSAGFASATPITVADGAAVVGIDAGLAAEGIIQGTVTTAGGAPLAEVCVTVTGPTAGLPATTGTDGRYEVGGLRAGKYLVHFRDCDASDGVHYLGEYFDDAATIDQARLVKVMAGRIRPRIDAALDLASAIEGTVTEESTGAPASGVCVTAWSGFTGGGLAGSVFVDGTGHYVINGLRAGSYHVEFEACSTADLAPEWWEDAPTLATAVPVEVGLSSTTPGIDAVLAPGGHIAGYVTGAGAPLAACVELTSEDGKRLMFDLTAADGSFDIGGLGDERYRVAVNDCATHPPLYGSEYFNNTIDRSAARLVRARPGETAAGIDVDLALGGRISGTVTDDATGAPVGGRCVRATPAAAAAESDSVDRFGSTDSAGHYVLAGLGAGNYLVQFGVCGLSHNNWYEWFGGVTNAVDATPVNVRVDRETPGIDAGVSLEFLTASAADASVDEGDSGSPRARFTVTLSAASVSMVTIHYATVDGTAVAPGDYVASAGTVTFAPGQTTRVVVVPVTPETVDEADEEFDLVLSDAVGAALGDLRAVGTITDDDP